MRHILALLVILSLGAAATAQQAPTDVDQTDPAATARAFMDAYRKREVGTVVPLMNARNQRTFAGVLANGDADPSYAMLFTGWRAEAVDDWDGSLAPIRREGRRALVPFGGTGSDSVVLVLDDEADLWVIEDVNRIPTADLRALEPLAE